MLVSSFPYAINWAQENVPAIVHLANSSQELGNGLADVLFGDYNPAGRTSQTWPKSLDQLPEMMDYNIRHGRTYMYFKGDPLYPFGFGLSYTTFQYSNLKLIPGDGTNEIVTAQFEIENTGKVAGAEVAQLYVHENNPSLPCPENELKGFKKVFLKPGEKQTVSIPLDQRAFAYFDPAKAGWVAETGDYQIQIGSSSRDLRLKERFHLGQTTVTK